MASTDVKDVVVEVKPNGETWVVKVLCNGTRVDVFRVCNCEGNLDDPGNVPDPNPDSEVCRIANGLGSYMMGRGNLFATLLDEQPDNEFGSLQTTISWMNSTYGTYLRGEWGDLLQLARDYNNTTSFELLSDQIPNMGEYLACAAYAAITRNPNGINLSPAFAQAYADAILEFVPTADPDEQYTFSFMSKLIPYIPLSTWKREALEASALDPVEAGDFDCDCGFAFPDEDVCSGVHWIWNTVNATPSGFSVPSGTPATLNTAWRTFLTTPPVNGDPALVDIQDNVCSRDPFDHWRCPVDNTAPIDYFMMVVYEFPDVCTLTQAHMKMATGTSNSKRCGIYYQLDGQTDPEDWIAYAENWVNLQGGFLITGATLSVPNVARICFCGAAGGGQIFMNETAINASLA